MEKCDVIAEVSFLLSVLGCIYGEEGTFDVVARSHIGIKDINEEIKLFVNLSNIFCFFDLFCD